MICRSCTGGKCRDLSKDNEKLEIECPLCNDQGCSECSGGTFEVEGCPNTYCSSVINAIDLIDLFDKGLPPVTGGVLDQSASFIHAARFLESEERRVKDERRNRDPD